MARDRQGDNAKENTNTHTREEDISVFLHTLFVMHVHIAQCNYIGIVLKLSGRVVGGVRGWGWGWGELGFRVKVRDKRLTRLTRLRAVATPQIPSLCRFFIIGA